MKILLNVVYYVLLHFVQLITIKTKMLKLLKRILNKLSILDLNGIYNYNWTNNSIIVYWKSINKIIKLTVCLLKILMNFCQVILNVYDP